MTTLLVSYIIIQAQKRLNIVTFQSQALSIFPAPTNIPYCSSCLNILGLTQVKVDTVNSVCFKLQPLEYQGSLAASLTDSCLVLNTLRVSAMRVGIEPCPCLTCSVTDLECVCLGCTLCSSQYVLSDGKCCPLQVSECQVCQARRGCECATCSKCLPGFMLYNGECLRCTAPSFMDFATGNCTCSLQFAYKNFNCVKCEYKTCATCV